MSLGFDAFGRLTFGQISGNSQSVILSAIGSAVSARFNWSADHTQRRWLFVASSKKWFCAIDIISPFLVTTLSLVAT